MDSGSQNAEGKVLLHLQQSSHKEVLEQTSIKYTCINPHYVNIFSHQFIKISFVLIMRYAQYCLLKGSQHLSLKMY